MRTAEGEQERKRFVEKNDKKKQKNISVRNPIAITLNLWWCDLAAKVDIIRNCRRIHDAGCERGRREESNFGLSTCGISPKGFVIRLNFRSAFVLVIFFSLRPFKGLNTLFIHFDLQKILHAATAEHDVKHSYQLFF